MCALHVKNLTIISHPVWFIHKLCGFLYVTVLYCQELIIPEVCWPGLEAESPEVGNAAIAYLIWSSLIEPIKLSDSWTENERLQNTFESKKC